MSLPGIDCGTKRRIIPRCRCCHSLTAKSAVADRHRQTSEFAQTVTRDLRAVYSGTELIIDWNKS